MTTKKPPIGIMPEYIWKEQRVVELTATIARYEQDENAEKYLSKIKEWKRELSRLLREL